MLASVIVAVIVDPAVVVIEAGFEVIEKSPDKSGETSGAG